MINNCLRKQAKLLLGHLQEHKLYHRAILEAVPPTILRHVSKSLKNLT